MIIIIKIEIILRSIHETKNAKLETNTKKREENN